MNKLVQGRSKTPSGATLRTLTSLSMWLAFVTSIAAAHEVRPAHLTIAETKTGHYLVNWKVPALAGAQRIAIDPQFASDVTVESDQLATFSGGASIQSFQISRPTGLAGTEIGFRNLSSTMIDVLIQVTFLDGRYHTSIVRPHAPVYLVPRRDSESSILSSYLVLGIEHILFGWDHLLFVLGLTILVTDRKRLFWAVTGFTIAHSITLSLAMLDIVRVAGPPVEAIIALSIVLLAVENIRVRRAGIESLAVRAPWLVSMAIGLIHGLGFAGALSEYGLPGHAKFIALFSFNLGVELGQVGFIIAMLLLAAVIGKVDRQILPRLQSATVSVIGVIGAYWLVERIYGFFV